MTKEEAIKKLNAIKKYLTAGNPIWDVREIDEALDMAIKALEELSKRRREAKRWKRKALKVEPVKHGKWEKGYRKTANGVDFLVLSCSECDNVDPQMNYYNFCPNCGAKMDKE